MMFDVLVLVVDVFSCVFDGDCDFVSVWMVVVEVVE